MTEKMQNDLNRGSVGERCAWDLLIKAQNTRTVVDVRDDKKFQSMDVDFLCETKNRNFVWFEVKTDYKAHETGNIIYEKSTSGNIGCFEKTRAEFILYYVYHSQTMYCIKTASLREFVQQNEQRLNLVEMGDSAKGYLIPIQALLDNGIINFHWENLF